MEPNNPLTPLLIIAVVSLVMSGRFPRRFRVWIAPFAILLLGLILVDGGWLRNGYVAPGITGAFIMLFGVGAAVYAFRTRQDDPVLPDASQSDGWSGELCYT